MTQAADTETGNGSLDEALAESFPASDPPSTWAGRDRVDPEAPDLPEPVPEADSPETARAWEDSGSMEGPAPTG